MFSPSLCCQLEVPLLSAHQMKMTAAGHQREPDSPLTEISGEAEVESPVKTDQEVTYRDELLNKMYKFMGVVDTTIQHLQIKGLFILRLNV